MSDPSRAMTPSHARPILPLHCHPSGPTRLAHPAPASPSHNTHTHTHTHTNTHHHHHHHLQHPSVGRCAPPPSLRPSLPHPLPAHLGPQPCTSPPFSHPFLPRLIPARSWTTALRSA
eukprot:359927-Chlamydomonas_euryale.AAC.9